MKTQIIRIELHDDAISVKDKMGWGQTARILLVWPLKGQILNRRLDLVYFKRHSTELGAQLAFVSKDKQVRYYAERLNIPVYSSISRAEMSHWRNLSRRKRLKIAQENTPVHSRQDSDKKPKETIDELRRLAQPQPISWLMHPIPRLSIFSLGVLAVLALGAILLPSATIEITPNTHSKSVTISTSASTSLRNSALAGTLPAQKINITVEGRSSTPSTGSIDIPDEKAKGEVVFINLADHSILIPSGTAISTLDDDPVRFITLESGEVEPGASSNKIPIEALQPGVDGNVLSNHILSIEGPLGLDMTVTNPIGTSKGSDQSSPAPDLSDYQEILDNILVELHKTATRELSTMLAPNDMVLGIDPVDYKILETVYSPESIQPSDNLQLTLRVEFSAFMVPGNEIISLAQSITEANSMEGFYCDPTSISVHPITPPIREDNDVYNWDMQVDWNTGAVIEESNVISQILWKTPDEVVQMLSSDFPVDEEINITITPRWWTRLPILPFRVRLINNAQ